jgi:hypothetical protein
MSFSQAKVPAEISPGMFPNERVAKIAHLDGEHEFFVQTHHLSPDEKYVLCTRLAVGFTWELLRVPSLEDPRTIVLRRGVAQ